MGLDNPSIEDLRILREGSIFDQLSVIKKFSRIQSWEVIQPLIEVLDKGNEEIIEAVAETLAELKNVSHRFLLTEIQHRSRFVRWGIALAMNKIGDPRYVEYLIPAIGIGYEPTINAILQTLYNLNPTRFPEPVLSEVLKKLTTEEKNAIGRNAIHQLGTDALDTTERLLSIQILNKLNWDKAIVPFIKELHYPDYRIRDEITLLLEKYPENTIMKECLHVIQEGAYNETDLDFNLPEQDHYPLYYYAIEGLGYVNQNKSHRMLVKFLRFGKSSEKLFAIAAFEKLTKSKKQTQIVILNIQQEIQQILHKANDNERKSLIIALAKIKDSWATSAISLYLEDQDPEIRIAVIQSMTQSKDKKILTNIAPLLIDEVERVRRMAVDLFWKLDPERFFGFNEGDIISKLDEPIQADLFKQLNEGLTTKSGRYREFAAFWLGIFRYPQSFQGLIANLKHPDENVVVKNIVALGMYGNKSAIPYLLPLIYSENGRIQRKSIESIGSIGLDGLYYLIHELFQRGPTNPPFLEEYIITFGGRILSLLTQEIENEKNTERKKNLMDFYLHVSERYQVENSKNFKVLL
jgi:HEAT repeat protein